MLHWRLQTDVGVMVRPKRGRAVLMDQDVLHRVSAPSASAEGRPRYSLVWKLVDTIPLLLLFTLRGLAVMHESWYTLSAGCIYALLTCQCCSCSGVLCPQHQSRQKGFS